MFDRAPDDFYIDLRGVWIPTEKEVEDLEEPRFTGGERWLYYVKDRGPEVRLLLGKKAEGPNPFRANEPFFVETYAELRKDGKSIRRTARLYPDNRHVYRQELADGKHSSLDLDYIARPLDAFEIRRKIKIPKGHYLSRTVVDQGSKDFIHPHGDYYKVGVGGEERLAETLNDACKLADWLTDQREDLEFDDWVVTRARRKSGA